MPTIQIPHRFTARPYQVEFLREVQAAMEGRSGKRYFIQCWHRRSGKDKTDVADVAPRRLLTSPTLVKYVYPTLVMGRDNLWDAMGSDGFKYIDHIPEEMRAGKANGTRMTIPIKGGSLFQVAGSDNPDSLRGGNAKLFIFSEWSEQDPRAFDVVEPILKENDGIGIFNFTPKGDNHAKQLLEFAKGRPDWFVQVLTALDTGVFTVDQLAQIKMDIIARFINQGRSETEAVAYFEQEYMCSFESPVIGAYYGEGMRRAESDGRITSVPYEATLPVHTVWDLGIGDSTAIWFYQQYGMQLRVIDYLESSGEGLPYYAGELNKKGYSYGRHIGPHDLAVRELGSGRSRQEIAQTLGINFEIAPKLSIDDGIEAARAILSKCWFDAAKCDRGLKAMRNYRKDWDDKNQVFRSAPKHDWSSHAADAFRYLAVSLQDLQAEMTGWRNPDYQ